MNTQGEIQQQHFKKWAPSFYLSPPSFLAHLVPKPGEPSQTRARRQDSAGSPWGPNAHSLSEGMNGAFLLSQDVCSLVFHVHALKLELTQQVSD